MKAIRVVLAFCALAIALPVLSVLAGADGALARLRGETAEDRAWHYGVSGRL